LCKKIFICPAGLKTIIYSSEMLVPPVFQQAYSENSHSKGFQGTEIDKSLKLKAVNPAKSLSHAA
jgi:hypothetical protein